MFALKDYQQKALTTLDGFFYKLRANGLDAAWLACAPLHEKNGQSWQAKYDPAALGDVPAVCVRISESAARIYDRAYAGGQFSPYLHFPPKPVPGTTTVLLWAIPLQKTLLPGNSRLTRETKGRHTGRRICLRPSY